VDLAGRYHLRRYHQHRALAAHYKRLKTNPEYKKLRDKTQIIGIYDDHDSAPTTPEKACPTKKAAKKCLLDFLDVPYSAPVRKQEGAYQSYLFGKGDQIWIKVIVLGYPLFPRYADPRSRPGPALLPQPDGDILGEAQWAWLERELTNSPAKLHILCSSIQVLANEHGHEKWGNFPQFPQAYVPTDCKNPTGQSDYPLRRPAHGRNQQNGPRRVCPTRSTILPPAASPTSAAASSETNRMRVGDMIVKTQLRPAQNSVGRQEPIRWLRWKCAACTMNCSCRRSRCKY
jgi:hypothetical protein